MIRRMSEIIILTLGIILVLSSQTYACFTVTKNCQDAVGVGEPITFTGTVTNCSSTTTYTNVTVVDDHAGTVLGPITLGPGISAGFSGSYFPLESPSTNTVTATVAGPWGTQTFTASATCLSEPPPIGCRVTGGGWDTAGLAVDGLNWDGTFAEAKMNGGNGQSNRYTFGGQAGANTALPPQPKGEWTHVNHFGPAGNFTFHAGTASAPEGTEIDQIICSDPGGCRPSGDPPSPAKQIDFAGVGTFKNIKSSDPLLIGVIPGVTFHWFDVHIEDLGEPGNLVKGVEKKNIVCVGNGSGTDAFDSPPVFNNANCGCADFYRIRIYAGFNPASAAPDKINVIYEVYGYIEGGNLQIHYLTGYDSK